VISVTPRVLRAPAVTPRDEEMRPSGTLQSPTTGSLAEMMREADREDHIAAVVRNAEREEQLAAARSLPRHADIQLPDAPLEVAKAVEPTLNAPRPIANNATSAATTQTAITQTASNTEAPTTPTQAPATPPAQAQNNKPATMEDLPSFVPAPKSLVSEKAAADVAAVNPSAAGAQNAVLTAAPKPAETKCETCCATQLPARRGNAQTRREASLRDSIELRDSVESGVGGVEVRSKGSEGPCSDSGHVGRHSHRRSATVYTIN
jgi:hypothetical protein